METEDQVIALLELNINILNDMQRDIEIIALQVARLTTQIDGMTLKHEGEIS